jgi:hypothetical protein
MPDQIMTPPSWIRYLTFDGGHVLVSEKLAAIVGIASSLATLVISIIELPKDPAALNLWIAFSASLLIATVLFFYWVRTNKRSQISGRDGNQKIEERRLRTEFPAIFAFVDSVGVIRNQGDFDHFVSQLNHLLDIERRARGIKWSEIKDIEAIKAIAYARLVAKRNQS